jgi:hypothetical protein
MKTPQPRKCVYFGMESPPLLCAKETWLEPEEMTYPSGGMKRRARAINKDTGKLQVVKCGLSDTWFSVAASGGFLSIDDDPESPNYRALIYHPYKEQ